MDYSIVRCRVPADMLGTSEVDLQNVARDCASRWDCCSRPKKLHFSDILRISYHVVRAVVSGTTKGNQHAVSIECILGRGGDGGRGVGMRGGGQLVRGITLFAHKTAILEV